MGCGLLPAPSCALPRHAGVGSREQAQPPFPLRGGRPPGPGGAEGRACGAPAAVGAGGGGGVGGPPPACPRVCAGGGGVGWGGSFGPLVMPLVGRGGGGGGGGGMAALVPGASHRPGGRARHPPPLSRAGCPRRPSPGPSPPRPLPRGAGRPGVVDG